MDQQNVCQVCGTSVRFGQMDSHKQFCYRDPNRPQIIPYSNNNIYQPSSQELIKCEYCLKNFVIQNIEQHNASCEALKYIQSLQEEMFQEQGQQQGQQSEAQDNQNNVNTFTQYLPNGRQRRVLRVVENDRQRIDYRRDPITQTQMVMPDGSIQRIIRIGNERGPRQPQVRYEFEDSFPRDILQHRFRSQSFLNLLKQLRNKGMSEDQINNLNTINYQLTSQLAEEHRKCVICLQEYQQNEVLIILPCTHRFHDNCISSWLKSSNECPVCKHSLRQ